MSDTIQGAKSREYIKSDIPGIENSGDTLEYSTVQELSGKRGGLDVVIHGQTLVSSGHVIEAGSVKRLIKSTAHGAKKGWVMRPSAGNSDDEEITIVKIVDSDFFVISAEFDLALADTFDLCKFITPNYTDTGDLNVVVNAAGPIQFSLDNVDTEVSEDSVVPANNTPLPSKMFIEIDGVMYPVKKDTGTPSNTVSVPVEITGASGPINITAGDINVQLTDLGANFDRTRIGDGTNQWDMNAFGEGLVHDADALTELQALNNVDFAQESTLTAVQSELSNIAAIDFATETTLSALQVRADLLATETKQDDQILLLTDIETALSPLSLEATQVDVKTAVEALNTKTPELGQALSAASTPVVLPAAQITALTPPAAITGFNLETTQTAMSAKLPSSLGAKTGANSLSVVPASDAVFKTSPQANQTASFVEDATVSTTPETFTAPAGAFAALIEADDTNSTNLRVAMGATASSTSGIQFQAGRSELYEGGSNISYCTESSTGKISVQWFIRS